MRSHEDHGVFVPLVLMQLESKFKQTPKSCSKTSWVNTQNVKTCQDLSNAIEHFERNMSSICCYDGGIIAQRELLRPTLMNIPVVQLSLPELSGQRGAEVARHCLEAVLTCFEHLELPKTLRLQDSKTNKCAGCDKDCALLSFDP